MNDTAMKEIPRKFYDEIFRKVEGWLFDHEARLLYNLARDRSIKGEVVEIGSWKGKSTVVLALALQETGGGKVHAIDPHTGNPEHGKVQTFEEFKENVRKAGVEANVAPIVKPSKEAAVGWTAPVRLLWIDGNHSYDFVKTDFEVWDPHLVNGGVVAFHDSIHAEGVSRVLKESLFPSDRYRNIGFVDNIVYAEKTEKITSAERMRNQVTLVKWAAHCRWQKKSWAVPGWIKKLLGRPINPALSAK